MTARFNGRRNIRLSVTCVVWGAMVAIEFVKDRKTKKPAKEFTVNLVKRCVENGVILIYAAHTVTFCVTSSRS